MKGTQFYNKSSLQVFSEIDSLKYFITKHILYSTFFFQVGIDAVAKAGGVVEASICYTGDVSNPDKTKYNIEYYMKLVEDLVKTGIHILNIKVRNEHAILLFYKKEWQSSLRAKLAQTEAIIDSMTKFN